MWHLHAPHAKPAARAVAVRMLQVFQLLVALARFNGEAALSSPAYFGAGASVDSYRATLVADRRAVTPGDVLKVTGACARVHACPCPAQLLQWSGVVVVSVSIRSWKYLGQRGMRRPPARLLHGLLWCCCSAWTDCVPGCCLPYAHRVLPCRPGAGGAGFRAGAAAGWHVGRAAGAGDGPVRQGPAVPSAGTSFACRTGTGNASWCPSAQDASYCNGDGGPSRRPWPLASAHRLQPITR